MKLIRPINRTPNVFPHSSVAVVALLLYILPFVQSGDKQKKKRDMFIHTVDDDKYETLLLLVKGNLHVPVAERTRSPKSAVVQFWRRKGLFTPGNEEGFTFYFNGKKVVKKWELSGVVKKNQLMKPNPPVTRS